MKNVSEINASQLITVGQQLIASTQLNVQEISVQYLLIPVEPVQHLRNVLTVDVTPKITADIMLTALRLPILNAQTINALFPSIPAIDVQFMKNALIDSATPENIADQIWIALQIIQSASKISVQLTTKDHADMTKIVLETKNV